MKRRVRAGRTAAGALAVMLLTGCNRVQNMLAPAGDQAVEIGGIWDLMLWVCVPVYVLVLVALGSAVWRRPARVPGDRILLRGLLVWSGVIAALLTVLTTASFGVDRRLHAPVEAPLQVRVTAHQWWWQIEYLDPLNPSRNLLTANELRLPAGRPAQIELRSADVIHSLWIPVLAGKEDLIPGYVNSITITPRVPGAYRGQCAEFCGLQHAHMALDVQVDAPDAFIAWWEAQLAPSRAPSTETARRGQQLFEQTACALCHRVRGTRAGGFTGPDLTHLASRRTLAASTLPLNRANLVAWILDPHEFKPGTHMPKAPLTPQDVEAIAAYLMELQ